MGERLVGLPPVRWVRWREKFEFRGGLCWAGIIKKQRAAWGVEREQNTLLVASCADHTSLRVHIAVPSNLATGPVVDVNICFFFDEKACGELKCY